MDTTFVSRDIKGFIRDLKSSRKVIIVLLMPAVSGFGDRGSCWFEDWPEVA